MPLIARDKKDNQPNLIADFLITECRDRGEVLTNLKLQKLLYYADAWNLALRDKTLFDEEFEAWVHGPVLPSQYARFREYRWQPITADIERPQLDPAIAAHLNEVIDVFGSEPAVALELMTHREKPWMEARGDLPPTASSKAKLSKQTMAEYYRLLAQ